MNLSFCKFNIPGCANLECKKHLLPDGYEGERIAGYMSDECVCYEWLSDFDRKVYRVVRKIPKGKITTYKLVAEAIGMPNHSRIVGKSLSYNPFAPKKFTESEVSRFSCDTEASDVPCHRVISSDGKIGGFFGNGELTSSNVKSKIELLKNEGVEFINGRISKGLMKSVLFTPKKLVEIEFVDDNE